MEEKKRLDRILLDLGLLTEEQIKHALKRQKVHGGRFGSNLLYHQYLTEAGLVRALSIQSGFAGVTLDEREIESKLLKYIPLDVARARKIIVFDIDREKQSLKVAVADPNQPGIEEELTFLAKGKSFEVFVASEVSIHRAIDKFYLGHERSLEESLPMRIPADLSEIGQREYDIDHEVGTDQSTSSRVVIVTDEEFAAPLIKSVIERNGPRVELVRSVEKARKILQRRFVESVFIRESLAENPRDIEASIRALNFRTEVKWFPNCSFLALGGLANSGRLDILKSIELLVSMLSAVRGDRDSRAIMVGRYASRICSKLGIHNINRQKIVTAGFLHHLARYSENDIPENASRKQIMDRTADLLHSINFDPELVEILRQAYVEPAGGAGERLSAPKLGGNILTLADHFCENFVAHEQITLVKFEEIKERYHDLTETMFLPEVVDAFILSLQEECLNIELTHTRGEVVFYFHQDARVDPFIAYHLRSKGVRATTSLTIEDLVHVCERRRPDLILIALPEKCDNPLEVVECMASLGVDLEHTPGILISQANLEKDIDRLYEAGVRDVVNDTSGYEILTAKALTMIERNRRPDRESSTPKAVAHGKLANINLIDLIQALGPGRKTVRISLVNKTGEELLIYLLEGSIVNATLGGIVGPAAIFEGITWLDGAFSVSQIDPDSIPEPNVDLPNESVLMEGCRLIDERARTGHS
ncbi:MAG: DUF4388 domain-containing protein [Candidatus Zixiibacteriota bacterium]